jgi:hypothetical protein
MMMMIKDNYDEDEIWDKNEDDEDNDGVMGTNNDM